MADHQWTLCECVFPQVASKEDMIPESFSLFHLIEPKIGEF